MFTQRKKWADALTHCSSLGLRLLEVRTQYDLARATQRFAEINGNQASVGMWLGGHNYNLQFEYKWNSNGEPINVHAFWATGYPYATAGFNCVALYNEKFYLRGCTGLKAFACE